jgi:DNA-binding transcriptional ArsR family regulator
MAENPSEADGVPHVARLSRVSRRQEEAILAALGDAQSRVLLLNLNEAPRTAQELMQICALPQASLYRKLRELQDSGLVGVQRSALTPDGRRTDLFRSTLVEATLRLSGNQLNVLAAFRGLASDRLADLWEQVRAARKK